MALANALRSAKTLLTPRGSSGSLRPDGFTVAAEGHLFPKVDPTIDGASCEQDCATCEVHLPKGFKIDETEKLYGHVKGWATHMLVATGKTDWVRDVEDEKGSVMEAVGKCKVEPSNGRLMLSASNMPLPEHTAAIAEAQRPTTVLLLPSFIFVDGVTPDSVKDLVESFISPSTTNTTRLSPEKPTVGISGNPPVKEQPLNADSIPISNIPGFTTRPCPHKYLILMCSQRTRDARCGQSAPLLRREFERQLRPLGLYRDLHDERPGGVGIYFISHVGGHKFSANVMVYRRAEGANAEASQCIWLARVRPEDCEGIVKFTVLQGKVVKPERQLRGGFDREKGLVSW